LKSQIAVGEGSGGLALLKGDGSALRRWSFPLGFSGAALQGRHLVVQTPAGLEDFDPATGALRRTWTLRVANARLADVQAGLVAYVAGTRVHLLRLTDGVEHVIRAPGAGPVQAQIEAPGLFYSYTAPGTKFPGRIAFVPFARLFQR